MAFHEVQFPRAIAFGSRGGPQRRTEIVALAGGGEERNAVWSRSLRRYNVGWGIKTYDDLMTVVDFWEERLGRLHGFRFRDPLDHKSCPPSQNPAATNQAIGTGTGALTTFQLVKTYGSGVTKYTRTIVKPMAGTVLVALNGVAQPSGWSVDTTTGTVTFTVAPANGVVVTAGFQFDVPARFDTDFIETDYSHFEAGAIQDIPILELRNP